jgi:hypothetical protein
MADQLAYIESAGVRFPHRVRWGSLNKTTVIKPKIPGENPGPRIMSLYPNAEEIGLDPIQCGFESHGGHARKNVGSNPTSGTLGFYVRCIWRNYLP